jgi:hypothetical protein
MGRKSKLTPEQWAEVDRRLLESESARAIAASLDVSEAIIRARKKTRVEKIKSAANQIVAADRAIKGLDISSQRIALSWAQKLQAMSDGLAEAGMLGAMNAADLKGLARAELVKAMEALQAGRLTDVATALAKMKELGGMANDEADIAIRLATPMKEAVRDAQKTPPADAPDLSTLDDGELDQLEQTMAKVGTRMPAQP